MYGSYTIHIAGRHRGKKHYALFVCKCPHDLGDADPRLAIRDGPKDFRMPRHLEPHRKCLLETQPQVSSAQALGLDSLRACRQIYHEAALKPFSNLLFSYPTKSYWLDNTNGLCAFLDALVPTQARAVTSLRLIIAYSSALERRTIARLSGLTKLEVDFRTFNSATPEYTVFASLYMHSKRLWFKEIGNLRHLKALRLSCEVEWDTLPVTATDEEAITDWLESAESRLLQPAR